MVKNMVLNETLKRQMEKNSWNEEETEKAFADFVKESFPEVWNAANQKLANLDPEDYDFFSSSWEITTNRRKGSGGKGDVWVGMLVGYDGERDTMQRQRDTAVSAAEANISQALRYGIKIKDRQIGLTERIFAFSKTTRNRQKWLTCLSALGSSLGTSKANSSKTAPLPKSSRWSVLSVRLMSI